MPGPTQGSTEQILARSLTNAALAVRCDQLAYSPRSYTREERDAFLNEAARRLRWPDAYVTHDENTAVDEWVLIAETYSPKGA